MIVVMVEAMASDRSLIKYVLCLCRWVLDTSISFPSGEWFKRIHSCFVIVSTYFSCEHHNPLMLREEIHRGLDPCQVFIPIRMLVLKIFSHSNIA